MRTYHRAAELHLRSAFSFSVLLWVGVTAVLTLLYLLRATMEDIPPQDHVGLAVLICVLLLATWFALDQWHVRISLAANRCWVKRHRMGTTRQQSLPVSQIHAAKLEISPHAMHRHARIVLVTSAGTIPIGESCTQSVRQSERACQAINDFLKRQNRYLAA